MKTTDSILNRIKISGPMTAKVLAEELNMTTMGVRQHLQALEDSGDLITEDIATGRGRPSRFWKLTQVSAVHFADRHEELSLQLIDSIKVVFGDAGMEKLIKQREVESLAVYQQAMEQAVTVEQRLTVLAQIRSDEGYMASWEQAGDDYLFIENHCPICAAATKCQNFCRSELKQFQILFKGIAQVTRDEHIVEGARRCAYRLEVN
ncbi:MAG: helix-turn-helix transcriptional regulator [Parashewanella sp.]